jgi:hypothetical protein
MEEDLVEEATTEVIEEAEEVEEIVEVTEEATVDRTNHLVEEEVVLKELTKILRNKFALT